jgi:Flp pilus assembly protein TadB
MAYIWALENMPPKKFGQEMRETIRRIRKRKTWVNPTGWKMTKGKWIILTVSFCLFALLTLFRAEIKLSIILLIVAITLTVIYFRIERQLKNRFKDIEKKFRTKTELGDER